MKRTYIFGFMLSVALLLSSCGGNDQSQAEAPAQDSVAEAPVSDEKQPEETFDDITEIFTQAFPDSTVSVRRQSSRISVDVTSSISADQPPDNWEEILQALNDALAQSEELAEGYGAATVSAQLETGDETILASGYSGAVQYDIFARASEQASESKSNPPTITQHEFDQISVGMTLTEVQDIVGGSGTLEREIGSSGSSISVIRTYRWEGTGSPVSYATVLFEDYVVYSKHSIGLE